MRMGPALTVGLHYTIFDRAQLPPPLRWIFALLADFEHHLSPPAG